MSRERHYVAVVILGLIGSVFVLKYAGRLSEMLGFGTLVYFLAFILAVKLSTIILRRHSSKLTRVNYSLFLVCITVMAAAAVFILPEKSRVSRLPAISAWLHAFLGGRYPYGIPTSPSSFPVLFFIAIPFYYLGNLGLIEVAGILIFGLVILRTDRADPHTAWLHIVTLVLLPTTYYEVLTRSELFFNMSLILAILLFADDHLNAKRVDIRFFFIAVLFGLALSTRSVVGLVYAPFVVFKFRNGSIANAVIFSFVVIATFCLTFIPFMFWNLHVFISDGPFAVQFGYVSYVTIGVALVASVVIGAAAENISDIFYYCGLIFFCLVLWAFVGSIIRVGFEETLFRNRFDVGYFIFCVPYLILSVGWDQKTRRDYSGALTRLP